MVAVAIVSEEEEKRDRNKRRDMQRMIGFECASKQNPNKAGNSIMIVD